MNEHQIAGVVNSVAILAVLIWFFRGPWQKLLEDYTRQRLFEVRARLFSMAADGRLAFDGAVYRALCHRINVIIRLCHTMKFSRFAAANACRDLFGDCSRSTKNFADILTEVDDADLRAQLEREVSKVFKYLILLMILRSFFLLVLFPIAFVVGRFNDSIKRLKRWVSAQIDEDIDLETELGAKFT